MNKKITLFVAVVLLNIAVSPVLYAQAPEPIDSPTRGTIKQDSGFVDQSGKPLSTEEYNKVREDSTKGIFEKQPLLSTIVGLILLGGVGFFIYKITVNKRT